MKKLLLLSVFGAAALLVATAGTARADHCRSYSYGYGYSPRAYNYGYTPYYGSRYSIGRGLRFRGHRHHLHHHHGHRHHGRHHGHRGFSLYFGGRNFGFGLHR